MAKEQYWTVENGIVKPAKLPGINHGKGEDNGYPYQTKGKEHKAKTNKKK